MKRYFLFFLALIGIMLTASGEQYVPQRGDYSFKTQLFTTTDDDMTVVDSIITTVTDKMGNSFMLVSYTEPLDPEYWHGFGDIQEDDINFDGVPDLMICLGPTNSFGGFTYDGYIWDSQEHKFVHVENFRDILDPMYFPDKNQIQGTLRIDNHYWTTLHEWQNGKLVLIKEDYFEFNMEEE